MIHRWGNRYMYIVVYKYTIQQRSFGDAERAVVDLREKTCAEISFIRSHAETDGVQHFSN